jgi:hypothetical protein
MDQALEILGQMTEANACLVDTNARLVSTIARREFTIFKLNERIKCLVEENEAGKKMVAQQAKALAASSQS